MVGSLTALPAIGLPRLVLPGDFFGDRGMMFHSRHIIGGLKPEHERVKGIVVLWAGGGHQSALAVGRAGARKPNEREVNVERGIIIVVPP